MVPTGAGGSPRWGWDGCGGSLTKPSSKGGTALPLAPGTNWRAQRAHSTSLCKIWDYVSWLLLEEREKNPNKAAELAGKSCTYINLGGCAQIWCALGSLDYKQVYLLPPGLFSAWVIFTGSVTLHLIRHLHTQLMQGAWWHKIITLAYKASHA